ncbi:hypothetical protein IQ266_12545 [filamentous cyanobacterium LEGE 11480]|uniref:CTP-dependent riboflavin kinase n=1 Tax=Romeriopsis navalis LEGE 11480 TaxID=2777977 RepID=A0A928Z3D4_9CYAN|nr:hypothetical protein [Romeriopsis navalis]MBE9030559.1 hypothetical protein [Romeriopsis navalis LEGE 11480]
MSIAVLKLHGIVQPGHQVASGLAPDSPYPAGTIALQTSHFLERGLDLGPYYAGTLNISIAPQQFQLLLPDYTFPDVQWIEGFDVETFSFLHCELRWNDCTAASLLYYPHPETKINHFQDPSIVEILAPRLEGIRYGDRVTLQFNPRAIAIT